MPPTCPTRTRLYRAGVLLEEGFPAEQIRDRLDSDEQAVAWLDLQNPTAADLRIVTEEFGLHPLSVEDALQAHQRPKVDRYRTHLFVNLYAVSVDKEGSSRQSELSAFLTRRALITVRKDAFDIDALVERWDLNDDLISAENEVSVLAYGLLDAVVDGHYDAVEKLDDATEDLQAILFESHPGVDVRRRGYELGSSVAALRRVIAPMQEVLGRLVRADIHLVDESLRPYYADIHDHVLRTVETLDAAQDRINRIVESELNDQGARLNEITKKLAAWAAIIAVPTAVTGFFGQNVPYPGFGHISGFVISTVVMIVFALGLFVVLRRNHWL